MASIKTSAGATSFGADAAAYAIGRPPYPEDLFAWLKACCNLGDSSRGLEIGAGTGLATLPILALPVAEIVAVEPDPALVVALLSAARGDRRLTVAPERFEAYSSPPAAFDFAFAAASFHWLRRMKAAVRIRDMLKPGGWLALWWPVFEQSSRPDAFATAVAHLFEGLEEGPRRSPVTAPGPRTPFALDAASRLGELRRAGFIDCAHRVFTRRVVFSTEAIVALHASYSRVAGAPPVVRERLLEGVHSIAREQFRGAVEREVTTSAFIARKPTV
ncbi:methyltransferase domain-containing protein [bacterium]|nr:methyltransferase domain-containing protein [bacterium]